jgi:hypothetical protein
MGNANRARHVERCSGRGDVSNCAIDAAAVELNRSGFENPLSRSCAAVFHAAALNQRSKDRVNGDRETWEKRKTIW